MRFIKPKDYILKLATLMDSNFYYFINSYINNLELWYDVFRNKKASDEQVSEFVSW